MVTKLKRIIILMVTIVLMLSLAGCSQSAPFSAVDENGMPITASQADSDSVGQKTDSIKTQKMILQDMRIR